MTVLYTLYPNEFNHYLTNSRACRTTTQACEMEAKFGSLYFNFNNFEGVNSCIIYARRKSGAGQIIIASGDKVIESRIISITLEYFSIDLAGTILEIKRPSNSIGAIEILKIDLCSDSLDTSQIAMNNRWKETLAKCKETRLIRVSNGRMFASEGAHIIADSIINVETVPPSIFNIKDNVVKFLGSCEVVNLEVGGVVRAGGNYLAHLDAPVQVLSIPSETQNSSVTVSQKEAVPNTIKKQTVGNVMNYDSFDNPNFSGVIASGPVSITERTIRMGHTGSVSIPMPFIQPGLAYVVNIELQKVNGNGKVNLSIQPTTKPATLLFAQPPVRTLGVTLYSGDYQAEHNLVISRPPAATGEIIISRIKLLSPPRILDLWAHAKVAKPMTDSVASFNISDDFIVTENNMNEVSGVYVMPENKEQKFVIVVPSYKNIDWTDKTLDSIFYQKYQNYRVIFIDDCSPDGTFSKANEMVNKWDKSSVTKLIHNDTRVGALANFYNAIHSCDNDEIIVTLDGDDWFAHEHVLERLQSIYANPDVWLTYGQYRSYPDNGPGCSQQIPKHIIDHNAFRQYRWCSSHLRTFYAWLFKKIKKEDLLDHAGNFYPMAWDLAFQFPMLEMGGTHCVFIPDVLYIYNVANPINDSKVNLALQQGLEREIRARPKYSKL